MDHAALSTSSTDLSGHIGEAFHLAVKIAVWQVSAVLAKFGAEDAAFWRIRWQCWYQVL